MCNKGVLYNKHTYIIYIFSLYYIPKGNLALCIRYFKRSCGVKAAISDSVSVGDEYVEESLLGEDFVFMVEKVWEKIIGEKEEDKDVTGKWRTDRAIEVVQ